jgi:hypothetical protein
MISKDQDKKGTDIDKEIRKKMDQREAENKALKKILDQIRNQAGK